LRSPCFSTNTVVNKQWLWWLAITSVSHITCEKNQQTHNRWFKGHKYRVLQLQGSSVLSFCSRQQWKSSSKQLTMHLQEVWDWLSRLVNYVNQACTTGNVDHSTFIHKLYHTSNIWNEVVIVAPQLLIMERVYTA